MDYTGLGRRIRRLRKSLHKTQEQLAEEIGISLSFLGHVERGSRKASLETLVGLAIALNVGTDDLLMDSLPHVSMVLLDRAQFQSQLDAIDADGALSALARLLSDYADSKTANGKNGTGNNGHAKQ